MKNYSNDTERDIQEKSKKNYLKLLAILQSFLEDFFDNPYSYITQYELMQGRALDVLNFAFSGYGLNLEYVVNRINDQNISYLSPDEIAERMMILNVIDNLINFSVCEEYHALNQIRIASNSYDEYGDDFEEEAEDIFEMFNYRFSTTENSDVYYAMAVASEWNRFDSLTSLTYTTQGDERVRDSHRALEGLTYLKRDFPEALIPPIDFRCRCYLVESSDNLASRNNPDDAYDRINNAVNPIFATTAAKSGRIFGMDHPYFQVQSKHYDELKNVVSVIKTSIGI
ncbi:MAG: minor capsid protein [Clostridia bacterium]